MKITLGTAAPPNRIGVHPVKLDLGILMSTRLLLTANSGQGKTFALKKLIEELAGHVQIIVVDVEGEFAPLRAKYDFALIGKGGEAKADVRTAAKLAHRLLEIRASAICDIYELKPRERHEWVAAFCEALVEAPKHLRRPCLIIIDEAQIFAPEKGESVAAEPLRDLAARGRKRHLCLIVATQRLAELSKSVTSLMQNRIIGGMFEDVDIKRAGENLGILPADYRAFAHQLRTLEPGMFWALGRAISKERVLFQVGAIKTAHGKAADKWLRKPPPLPKNLKKLLPQLADLPKEVEEDANTIAGLQRQVRDLKLQSRAALATVATHTIVHTSDEFKKLQAEVLTLRRAVTEFQRQAATVESYKADAEKFAAEVAKASLHVHATLSQLHFAPRKIAAQPTPKASEKFGLVEKQDGAGKYLSVKQPMPPQRSYLTPPKAVTTPTKAPGQALPGAAEGTVQPGINGSQVKMLQALKRLEQVGIDRPSRAQVAFWAGARVTSSAFSNNAGNLKTRGLVDYPGDGVIMLTDEGRVIAGAVPVILADDVFKGGAALLNTPQQKMLKALYDSGPLTREALSERAQVAAVTSSAFSNNLGGMKTAGLVEYPQKGTVKLAAWLANL